MNNYSSVDAGKFWDSV